MLPIQIDHTLCKADGLCVHECPLAVLMISEKGKAPVINPKKMNYCINCGHCAAICPTNAITITAFEDQSSIPINHAGMPDFSSVENLMKSRRSIRKFKKTALTAKQVEELIHLAAYAPSGHNAHPVSWSVINSSDKMQELTLIAVEWMEEMVRQKSPLAKKLFLSGLINAYKNGNDAISRNAPTIAAAWAPKQGITPQTDTVIATTYLELAAHAQNIGTCWAGYIILAASYSEKIRNFLGIPKDHMLYGALLLGYPAVKYKNSPPRHKAEGKKTEFGTIFHARLNGH
ncbi:nitroreductase family protein [Maridesulfovibrio zosterae]|uniref:nitroreductase family protein n=1 Tax=Maridesulfovibrio zosterae TaxID=82171 RepID=UPI0004023CB9|nr:nitroreductase family protein [Maridesulfovibrio zosterae]